MLDQGGAGGMREPGGAGGSMGDGGGEGARSRGGATGSTDRGGVRASEAGGGGEGKSSPGDAGGWQSRGAVRSPVQYSSQLNPPPCPAVPDVQSAHPQPRCRRRSSTPRSHCPWLAPSWWALSPALAPDLTGWAQLPGRSSAQSLGFALARRSRREMALRHLWARAGAPHRREMVGWALGLEWIWRDHPQGRQ